jgi:hypothetical protein
VLQVKPDVFHAFVNSPHKEKVERLKTRLEKGVNIEQRMKTVDAERAKYLQEYFGKNWANPHLYHLMISSKADEEQTARTIAYAMTGKALG